MVVQVDRQHRPCSAATLHAGGLTFQRQGREGGSQRVFAILSGASQVVSGLASWWGTPLPWRVRRPGQLSEGWSGMTGETRIPLRWKRSYPAWRFIAQGDRAEKGINLLETLRLPWGPLANCDSIVFATLIGCLFSITKTNFHLNFCIHAGVALQDMPKTDGSIASTETLPVSLAPFPTPNHHKLPIASHFLHAISMHQGGL